MRFISSIFIIAACMLPISCAKETSRTRDPVFEPLLSSFISYGLAYGYDVKNWGEIEIKFVDHLDVDKESAIGACDGVETPDPTDRGLTNSIEILRSWWDKASATGHEEVLFHEFGHCLLDRDHDDTLIRQLPASIMNEREVGDSVYGQYRDGYIHELFEPGWRFL